MGGIERTREGITVTSRALIAMLSVVITLLSGTVAGTYWATSTLLGVESKVQGVESEVEGLRQALDYSVERTARALTIVRDQNQDINMLERELAVVKNRLDNMDRLRTRFNDTGIEQ